MNKLQYVILSQFAIHYCAQDIILLRVHSCGYSVYHTVLLLEKCKTLRGEPELIMSCTHDSLKIGGLNGIYLKINE